jgi:hypothetical protein
MVNGEKSHIFWNGSDYAKLSNAPGGAGTFTSVTTGNGTAAAPAITGTDTDSGVYFGTNTVALSTNGTAAVTVDSSQNVGVGTSSPAAKVDVAGAASSVGFKVRGGGNSGINILDVADAGGSGRTIINASGNLGVGTTSPVGRIDSLANGYAAFVARSAGSGAGQSVASLTSIDSTAANYAAAIYAASVHAFYIAATEVGRFDANGRLGVGTVTPTGQIHSANTAGYVGVTVTTTNNHGVLSQVSGTGYGVYGYSSSSSYGGVLGYDPTNTYFTILGYGGYSLYANSSAYIGGVVYPSDRRLKENDQNITNALSKVMQLRAVSFDWKAESSRGIQKGGATPDYGFIAQEVETVLPDLVHSATSPARPEGITSPLSLEEQLGEHKGIDYARFVPFLTAAIQEQQVLITQLTDRIAALEAK